MPKKSKRSSKRSSLNSGGTGSTPGLQRRGYSPSCLVWLGIAAGVILLAFVNSAVSFSKDYVSKLDGGRAAEVKEEHGKGLFAELANERSSSDEGYEDRKPDGVGERSEPVLETVNQTRQEEKLIIGDNVGDLNEEGFKADDADLAKEEDQLLKPVSHQSRVVPPGEDGEGRNSLQPLDAREYREHGAGLLLKSSGSEGGSPKVCLAGEPSAAECGQEGDIILPRCLVAVPVVSKEVLPCIEDLLPVDLSCDGGEQDINTEMMLNNPVADASSAFVFCFHNPISGSATCGSICSLGESTSGSKTRVCLCGAGLQRFLLDEPRICKNLETENLPNIVGPSVRVSDGLDGSLGYEATETLDGASSPSQTVTVLTIIGMDETGATTHLNVKPSPPHAGTIDSFAALEETSDLISSVPSETESLLLEGAMQTDVVKPVLDGLVGLDEFKKSQLEKQQQVQTTNANASGATGHVIRRTSGDYNFAAATHGAKVVACSKEAKGAKNILEKDKDKYLRIPCNVEDKFVVIRLSAETQVDTFVISNFEFYSSNLKDFELLGSKVFPTDDWVSLGKFQAENVRHPQTFDVTESKLVRFVKLQMLTHYGSDFYCTLSMVEVQGVDEIESLLEGWIPAEPDNGVKSQHSGTVLQEESLSTGAGRATQNSPAHVASSVASHSASSSSLQASTTGEVNDVLGNNPEKSVKDPSTGESVVAGAGELGSYTMIGPSVQETVHVHSRPTGEAALKIVMQKVKSLEINQSLLDQYVEDLNVRIKDTFYNFGQELFVLTEKLRNETATSANLATRLQEMEAKMKMESEVLDNVIASKFNNVSADYAFLRLQMRRMEDRESRAIILSFLTTIISSVLLLTLKGRNVNDSGKPVRKCQTDFFLSIAYLLIIWNTTIVVLVLIA